MFSLERLRGPVHLEPASMLQDGLGWDASQGQLRKYILVTDCALTRPTQEFLCQALKHRGLTAHMLSGWTCEKKLLW